MAIGSVIYYRNYDVLDTTQLSASLNADVSAPTISDTGWDAPNGYQFKEWNTSQNGTGTSLQPGTTPQSVGINDGYVYAIWERILTPYLVTNVELENVANAIRTKGGTQASLEWPNGYISAVGAISTGGGSGYTIDDIAMRTMMSGEISGNASFIANYAFNYCSSLTTVSFPSCTTIGSSAFGYCTNLTTASFPLCTSIGSSAFCYCYSLTTISFPLCKTIGNSAFYSCTSLTTISFPSCTSIGSNTFNRCTKLTTISFPLCKIIGSTAFYYCSSLTTVSFPLCTSIGSDVFGYCSNLTTANFPLCTSIGNSAFRNCVNFISLYLTSVSKVPTLGGTNVFGSTPIGGYSASAGQYGSVYVPASLFSSFKTATYWSSISARIVSV